MENSCITISNITAENIKPEEISVQNIDLTITPDVPHRITKGKARHFNEEISTGPRKFNKPGVYPCEVCGKVYKWQPSLSKHKHKCNRHTVYRCYICEYTCLSSNQLHHHHQALQQDVCYCLLSKCLTQSTKKIYKCHKPGSFPCTNCGKIYKWQPSLSNHRKYECGKAATFKCDFCDFVCKLKHNLQKHIVIKHFKLPIAIELKEDSFSGDEYKPWLGWSATRGDVLSNINKLPQQTKPVVKKRISEASGRRHGNFPCHKCTRSYIRKDSLQRHLQWECGKEPQFQCPFCPQKCKRKAHQIRHIQRQHKDMIGMLDENNPDFKFEVLNVE
ncbi:longitudinals lacking [Carabus blaptoides fortunei]